MPERGHFVIDGLRHPEDRSFLAEKFGPDFVHIHINAPETIRCERYVSEGTKAEFSKAVAHQVESNVPKLADLAHTALENVDTPQMFLDAILETVNNSFEREGSIVFRHT